MRVCKVGDIGKRVYEARKSLNLSQDKLAQKLGVSYQAVSKWERGENDPSIEMIVKLSHVLKTSVDYLVCNDGYIDSSDSVTVKISTKDLLYMIHDMDPEEIGLSKMPFHTLEGSKDGVKVAIQLVQDERSYG